MSRVIFPCKLYQVKHEYHYHPTSITLIRISSDRSVASLCSRMSPLHWEITPSMTPLRVWEAALCRSADWMFPWVNSFHCSGVIAWDTIGAGPVWNPSWELWLLSPWQCSSIFREQDLSSKSFLSLKRQDFRILDCSFALFSVFSSKFWTPRITSTSFINCFSGSSWTRSIVSRLDRYSRQWRETYHQ